MPKLSRAKGKRRQPSKQIRIRGAYLDPLAKLAERNATSPPEEVNRAVRELLERERLWPPASE